MGQAFVLSRGIRSFVATACVSAALLLGVCADESRVRMSPAAPVTPTLKLVSATSTPRPLPIIYIRLVGPGETYFMVKDEQLYRIIHRDLEWRKTESLNDAIFRGDTVQVHHGERALLLNGERRQSAALVELLEGSGAGQRGWLPWKVISGENPMER